MQIETLLKCESELAQVSFKELHARKQFNPRVHHQIDDLDSSIEELGLMQPLVVFEMPNDKRVDRYVIVDGHRRYKCLEKFVLEGKMSEDTDVPIRRLLVTPDKTRQLELLLSFNKGKPLNMLELGVGFRDLRAGNINLTNVAISKMFSYSSGHVGNCVFLAENITDDLRERIATGELSASAVWRNLKSPDQQGVDKQEPVQIPDLNEEPVKVEESSDPGPVAKSRPSVIDENADTSASPASFVQQEEEDRFSRELRLLREDLEAAILPADRQVMYFKALALLTDYSTFTISKDKLIAEFRWKTDDEVTSVGEVASPYDSYGKPVPKPVKKGK